jgi:hypothetical protein
MIIGKSAYTENDRRAAKQMYQNFTAAGHVLARYWEGHPDCYKRLKDFGSFTTTAVHNGVNNVFRALNAKGLKGDVRGLTVPWMDNLAVVEMDAAGLSECMEALYTGTMPDEGATQRNVVTQASPAIVFCDQPFLNAVLGREAYIGHLQPWEQYTIITLKSYITQKTLMDVDPTWVRLRVAVMGGDRNALDEMKKRAMWVSRAVRDFVLAHEATHAIQMRLGLMDKSITVYSEDMGHLSIRREGAYQDNPDRNAGESLGFSNFALLEDMADRTAIYDLLAGKDGLNIKDIREAGVIISALLETDTIFRGKIKEKKFFDYSNLLYRAYNKEHINRVYHATTRSPFGANTVETVLDRMNKIRKGAANAGLVEADTYVPMPPPGTPNEEVDNYMEMVRLAWYVPKNFFGEKPTKKRLEHAVAGDDASIDDTSYFYGPTGPATFGVTVDPFTRLRWWMDYNTLSNPEAKEMANQIIISFDETGRIGS